MSEFTVILNTSKTIQQLLQEKINEDFEIIGNPINIVLVAPNDTNVDYQIGLYLYDIKEITEIRRTAPIIEGDFRKEPPKLLELSYILFSNHRAQTRLDADTEQKFFGRALQVIYDTGITNLKELNSDNQFIQTDEKVAISVINQNFEDKTKVWTAFQSPYRLSVCFTVSAIELDSRRIETISRVRETTVTAKQMR